jgi:hypothetical protein
MIFISLSGDSFTGDQGEGLYVHKIKETLNQKLYDGLEFTTRVTDTRDLEKNLYELRFKEASYELMFIKPAMESCLRDDKVLIDPRITRAGEGHNSTVIGRDAARVSFEKKVRQKPALEKRTFEVFLPESVKLSQGPFGGQHTVGRPGEFHMARSQTYMWRMPFEPSHAAHREAEARARVITDAAARRDAMRLVPRARDTFHTFLSWRFIDLATETELELGINNVADDLARGFRGL